MLLTLLAGLLIATVSTVGAVAFFNLRASIDELFEDRFREISRGATDRVQDLLEPAVSILRECNTKAKRELWPMDNMDQLGIELIERLRYEPTLTWLSYGDEYGRFVGARRDDDGSLIVNRSWWISLIGKGGVDEHVIQPNGTRIFKRAEDSTYDPRERPFYALAVATTQPAWTEPYEWWNHEGYGITCCMAFRQHGKVKGVFTADFRLDRLEKFLTGIRIGQTGRAIIINSTNNEVVAEPQTGIQLPEGAVRGAIASLPLALSRLGPGDTQLTSFEFDGQSYSAAFEALPLGSDMHWVTAVVVPQRELLGKVRQNTLWTIAIGALSLLAALVLGNVLAGRFIRPLQYLSDDLERVGNFDLSSGAIPPTQVREIHIMGQTAERMKASLRSFARYVPTDLVRQLLARGEEASLGARPEILTICFIDIEGFSKISEHTTAHELVERLGVYFDAVSNMLAEHGATIDKFIGDGLLAFFNAPTPIPDHAVSACQAALAIQQVLRKLNAFWEQQRMPTFKTRIGLHTGEVLVGNIGTPSRFAYTVVGDGVNLADALESLNKVYGTSILVSEEVRRAAGAAELFEWRRIDRVAVKGRARGGFVFELIGLKGHISDSACKARDIYERALNDYFQRRFDDAILGFHEALDANPSDRAAQVLLTRCRVLAQAPPPREWSGVFVHSPS